MKDIIIAGRELSQFPIKINGTSTIDKNSDGTWTFKSTDTNSNAYGYYNVPAIFGETVSLTVTAVSLEEADDNQKYPSIAVRWISANGVWKQSSENYVNSTMVGVYTAELTVNEPVDPGDIIQVSFGHFRPSMASGKFFDAQVNISNSMYPVARKMFASTLTIEASKAGELPDFSYKTQFQQLNLNMIKWDDNSTLILQDDQLKVANAENNLWYVNPKILMSLPELSDYFTVNVFHGMYDWTGGSFKLTFADTKTGKLIDFKTDATKKLVIQYEINI
ncbi:MULTISPECIES: hypothetical protein [Commensalibacter]|uniref:hypothetical protein n=1 Tax=Commensalibacter TaxID=1079922 RepID=UPI0018DDEA95|nr:MULTISPECIES: hypothetical protein [Commensalibacter]MBH9972628.1 hypothetical protein [Commensalibacter melissae]MBI0016840.1 hypothetical protein [Commensalibacter sp. B14384M2]MBI0018585.1 hypothetical protein [Commensalibacter sp. W8133]MBI0050034.1 hypothetical protein [Commensalibacter sp. B14384M3]MBI0179218.1 hypothetical protein [Commensalibacter sp. W8163]